MGIFDDASLDDRARTIIVGNGKRTLGDASLHAAALHHTTPSPAMIEGDAEWLEIIDELATAGFTPDEVIRVCVRATMRVFQRKEGPGPSVLAKLFANPTVSTLVRAIADEIAALPEPTSAQREIAAAIAAPPAVHTEPTPHARDALEKMLRRHRQARAVRSLSTFVEWAYDARRIRVDAPELATLDAWSAASDERRREIADNVARTLSQYLDHGGGGTTWRASIESYGGPPIAVVTRGTKRMSIVPGGTVEVGFSEEEEAAVRASAEINAGCRNHHELYEALFDSVDIMRPVVRVTVRPMLVMQGEPEALPLTEARGALVESLFRVPSDAEWEHLARGGKARELTYRGDVVPDTRDEYLATMAGAETANAFGLWGFGLQPEVCADRWSESHDDLPLDGSPRRGDGPRVVRGGAALLSPWQDAGEWHMLLTAFRTPDTTWTHVIATRHALGIDIES